MSCYWFPRQQPWFTTVISTSLYRETNQDITFAKPFGVISNHQLRLVNLGYDVHLPTPWMMKPWTFNLQLNDWQQKFNTTLSSARITVERGFGLLKMAVEVCHETSRKQTSKCNKYYHLLICFAKHMSN